jgi:hypothetical protein
MENILQGLLSPQLSSLLFLVVGISMAMTPYLAAGGQFLASKFEQHDVRSLLPVESEVYFFFYIVQLSYNLFFWSNLSVIMAEAEI